MVSRGMVVGSSRRCFIRRVIYPALLPATMIPDGLDPAPSIDGASFHSYLTHSSAWYQLSPAQREEFAKQLPFQRSDGPESGVDGYLSKDLTYSAGNRALDRASLRRL